MSHNSQTIPNPSLIRMQLQFPPPLQTIPGNTDAAPTSIAIVDQGRDAPCRIFTAGLDGNIVEADIERGVPAAISDSYGGAVWQIASTTITTTTTTTTGAHDSDDDSDGGNNNENNEESQHTSIQPVLAAACDDGCVRIFSVDPGIPGASYSKSLPKVDGRTLSIAWHPTSNGQYLASAGSDGCIHLWEVPTGREALRITCGGSGSGSGSGTRNAASKEVEEDGDKDSLCIWTLKILCDGTIVAGDSRGHVTFWDGQFGTLLARFNQHHADVLQVAASMDETTIFAAGIDSQISVFHKSSSSSAKAWTYLSSKRPHTHDVRALCVVAPRTTTVEQTQKHKNNNKSLGGMLWSGGNDTRLLMHGAVERFFKQHPVRVNPCPQRPIIACSSQRSGGGSGGGMAMVAAQRNQVEVWTLPSANTSPRLLSAHSHTHPPTAIPTKEGERVVPSSLPVHIARLVNGSGGAVVAVAVSEDGGFIAYADARRMKCFRVGGEEEEEEGEGEGRSRPHPRVEVISLPPDLPPARHLFVRQGDSDGDGTRGDKNEKYELVAVAVDGIVRILSLDGTNNSMKVTQTVRELHDVKYKIWYKKDKGRSTARWVVPVVEQATLSSNGTLLAASIRGRVHIVSLESQHRGVTAIPPPVEGVPLAALGFTPDSSVIVTVTAANHVLAYQVPSGAPAEWSVKNPLEALPKRLVMLPGGAVVGVSPGPSGPLSVLLYTSEAVVHLDMSVPTVGGGSGGGSGKRKRQRRRDGGGGDDGGAVVAFGKQGDHTVTPAGENGRTLYSTDPVLYVHGGGGEVVVVERSWSDVHRDLAPPMYRHRYGT